MRTLASALLIASGLSACATWPTGSAIDDLKPDAAAHAEALSGSDVPRMRETGLALLARLSALAEW